MPGGDKPSRRFLTIEQVAEELATSEVQIRSMLKTGQLKGIQIGAETSGASDAKTYSPVTLLHGRLAHETRPGRMHEADGEVRSQPLPGGVSQHILQRCRQEIGGLATGGA
jgi:hypothetical protein